MKFVPESLSAEILWWLKHSLVRQMDATSCQNFTIHYYCYTNYKRRCLRFIYHLTQHHGRSHHMSTLEVANLLFGSGEMTGSSLALLIIKQAHMESEVDVYPNSVLNSCYQLCTGNFLGMSSGEIVTTNRLHIDFLEPIFTY